MRLSPLPLGDHSILETLFSTYLRTVINWEYIPCTSTLLQLTWRSSNKNTQREQTHLPLAIRIVVVMWSGKATTGLYLPAVLQVYAQPQFQRYAHLKYLQERHVLVLEPKESRTPSLNSVIFVPFGSEMKTSSTGKKEKVQFCTRPFLTADSAQSIRRSSHSVLQSGCSSQISPASTSRSPKV